MGLSDGTAWEKEHGADATNQFKLMKGILAINKAIEGDYMANKEENAAEAKHQYMMRTDVDYAQDYLDSSIGIRSRLGQLKDYCKLYDLDFDEVLDVYKDEL